VLPRGALVASLAFHALLPLAPRWVKGLATSYIRASLSRLHLTRRHQRRALLRAFRGGQTYLPPLSFPMRPSSLALRLFAALLLCLALASSLYAYALYSFSPVSSPSVYSYPVSSFRISSSSSPSSSPFPLASSDYEAGVLSFASNSALNVTLSPASSPPPNLTTPPYLANLTFSLYWGYLFRWSFYVSPGSLSGEAVSVAFVPLNSSSSPSPLARVLVNGRAVANASGSATLTFSYDSVKERLRLLEGNSTLATWSGSFSPSPSVGVRAEKGAPVLLNLNYVSLSSERDYALARAQRAATYFAYGLLSLPLLVAVAVEWEPFSSLFSRALYFAEARLTKYFALAALVLGGAAGTYEYALRDEPLANDFALAAYFALLVAVLLELLKVDREVRRGG